MVPALILIGTWIWNAFKAVESVLVHALVWTVKWLWAVVVIISNGLTKLGVSVVTGLKKVWSLLDTAYEKAIKPFIVKVWALVDRVHRALEKIFGPVLRFLARIRAELLKFYATFMRPVFDTIDLVRAILRVLAALHLEFAQALDAALGDLESKIQAPFDYLLGKVNELIGWINRIVDADGLFQRLTLLRSLAQHAADSWNVLLHPQVKGLTPEEASSARAQKYAGIDPVALAGALREYYETDSGELAPVIAELVATWKVAAGLSPE